MNSKNLIYKNNIITLCKKNLNISEVTFYNSFTDKNEKISDKNISTRFSFIKGNSYNSNKKTMSSFYVNMDLFMEAQMHNVFFNRKLVVSSLGFFTNSIDEIRDVWNFEKKSFLEVVYSKEFRQNWTVNKDSIEVCKDCEYRYMCIDGRIPKKIEKESRWYFDTKCSYDPYNAEWG